MSTSNKLRSGAATLRVSSHRSIDAPLVVHREVPLKDLPALRSHNYVLISDDDSQIIGVVPSSEISRRLLSPNNFERTRWAAMPIGVMSTLSFSESQNSSPVLRDGEIECTAILQGDVLFGLSVEGDLFFNWERLESVFSAALSDPLTGLMNRRELLRNLEDDRRHGAMLYIDVDDFKSVNDNFGHQVGDAVLITVAERILAACRAGDSVGRVGGDEFVVLLHGADQELGRRIGERIVRAVSEPLGLEVGPESVAVSIGLAPLDSDNPLDAADHAMLRAKRSGRGRLELALVD